MNAPEFENASELPQPNQAESAAAEDSLAAATSNAAGNPKGAEPAQLAKGSSLLSLARNVAMATCLIPLLLVGGMRLSMILGKSAGNEWYLLLSFALGMVSVVVVPLALLLSVIALVIGVIHRSGRTLFFASIGTTLNLLLVILIYSVVRARM